MRRPIRLLSAILACAPAVAIAAAAPARAQQPAAAFAAQVVSVDPVVLSGNKDAPVMRITFPAAGNRLPLVVLSHGNRLSRHDYQPLVAALARAGYVVIQPDHPDASVDGFAPTVPQPDDAWRVRVEQLRWVVGHVRTITDRVPGLRGRVDDSRIALIGHSFGGQSVALAIGAKVAGQPELPPIAGIRATVMLAPPGGYEGLTPEWKARADYLRTDWRSMHGPALVINGGNDRTPLTDQGPAWHDETFNEAPAGQDICLMVVQDAGHYLGGIDSVLRPPAGDATPERRAAVQRGVISFLGAHLHHRPADRALWAEQRKALLCK